MKRLWLIVLLAVPPGDALAQAAGAGSAPRILLPAPDSLTFAQQTNRSGTRDSLRNGTLIGAIIGGATLAVMTTYLCVNVGEEGDPPCWQGVLVVSAVGAGIGAAAGAGIDAMLSQSSPGPAATRDPRRDRRVALTWRQRF